MSQNYMHRLLPSNRYVSKNLIWFSLADQSIYDFASVKKIKITGHQYHFARRCKYKKFLTLISVLKILICSECSDEYGDVLLAYEVIVHLS
jgi:hypothetical protein